LTRGFIMSQLENTTNPSRARSTQTQTHPRSRSGSLSGFFVAPLISWSPGRPFPRTS
jgi:hypothetical protein